MQITITITTDNDAFTTDGHQDTERIYFELIKVLAQLHTSVRTRGLANSDGLHLLDTNGNTVGLVRVEE